MPNPDLTQSCLFPIDDEQSEKPVHLHPTQENTWSLGPWGLQCDILPNGKNELVQESFCQKQWYYNRGATIQHLPNSVADILIGWDFKPILTIKFLSDKSKNSDRYDE
jgi:hypothetical protein